MKQTAVEYIDNVLNELIEKFNTKDYKIARNTLRNFKNIVIDKAKEMEKSQNKYFYDHGFYTGICTDNNKHESFEYFFNSYKSE
jgi:hypothetical protein